MLLDTSGLLCCHNVKEPKNREARQLFAQPLQKITHGYVLDEFVALANARRLPRAETIAFARSLLDFPEIEVVWVDETLHRQGLALLEARLDKAYSLCDAISFILMRQRGLTDALTTDHHFEQEGFRALLR